MARQREHKKRLHFRRSLRIRFIATFFLCFLTLSSAYAESVVLPALGYRQTSGFGPRSAPKAGASTVHRGQDYGVGEGTNISYTGNYQSCKPSGGAGNMATVANACDITQIFMHLKSCNDGAKTITSGNTGTSTGAHLHYEIRIAGTPVDPIKAFGKNLCDGAVRKELLDDAKNRVGNGGSAGARETSNTSAPAATTSTGSSTIVNNGEVNPVTGTVNTGAAYYYYDNGDGIFRTDILPPDDEDGGESTQSFLPPSTTSNLVPSGGSGNSEVTGCGTDTWTAMVNQAVLQTRREMMINQTLVTKPDSVFAYSCFNEAVKIVGEKLGPVFSETKVWVNKQIDIVGKTVTVNKELGDTSLDGAISNSTLQPAESFASSNFNHGLLGGKGSGGGGGGGEESGGTQGSLPCGTMASVWQQAKCMNFTAEPGFPTFDKLIDKNSDTRKYPPNMKCLDTGISQEMIDLAKNKSVKFDKVNLYMDMLKPDGNTCYEKAFATGVTVVRRSGEGIISQEIKYPDGVCISPGCSYQNDGGSGKGTCKVKGP